MLQTPLADQKKTDSVTLPSTDPAKPEYAVTINREELFNIVGFLPVTAILRNNRYGEGKIFVPLVVADLKNETSPYSENGKIGSKFQWRYSMFKEFLKNSHLKLENKNKEDSDIENAEFDK